MAEGVDFSTGIAAPSAILLDKTIPATNVSAEIVRIFGLDIIDSLICCFYKVISLDLKTGLK